jgi:hypothetical protein
LSNNAIFGEWHSADRFPPKVLPAQFRDHIRPGGFKPS